ncbi:MAG: hypothetical protein MUE73_21510 [Planctomycetes bacterium]|nr:hypothetical protein [Planctomycetota bacterium]
MPPIVLPRGVAIRSFCACLLLSFAAGPGSGEEESREVIRADHGIRLRLPGPGWAAGEVPASGEAFFALKAQRPDPAGEVSLTVYLCDRGSIGDAPTARAVAERRWRDRADVVSLHLRTIRVAGTDAPALDLIRRSGGVDHAVRQVFLLREQTICIVQTLAPAASLEAVGTEFASLLASLSLSAPTDPRKAVEEATLRHRQILPRAGRSRPPAECESAANPADVSGTPG